MAFKWTKTKIIVGGVVLALVLGGATTGIVLGLKNNETPEEEQEEPTKEPIQITTEMFTAPQALTDLHYNFSKQEVINAGQCEYGTFMYKISGGEWNSTTPLIQEIGTHQVSWYIDAKEGYIDYGSQSEPKTLSVSIAKGILRDDQVIAPTANYDSASLDLLNAGSTVVGTFMYSLDGVNFSAKIPQANEKGTYTVSWYIEGNDYYESYAKDAPKTVTVSLEKLKLTIDQVFLPNAQFAKSPVSDFYPINPGLSYEDGVEFYYSYDKVTFSKTLESLKNPADGKYTVYWYVTGNDKYYGIGSKENPMSTYGELAANMPELFVDYMPPCIAYDTEHTGNPIKLLEEPIIYAEEGFGTFYYSLDGVNYSTEIPTATEVGVYSTFWYCTAGEKYAGIGSAEQPIENIVEIY